MSRLVHNERIKYLATFFNNLGLAFLIAGGLNATLNKQIWDFDFNVWDSIGLGIFGCVFCVGFAQVAVLRHLKE
jgi:hypothetical protein